MRGAPALGLGGIFDSHSFSETELQVLNLIPFKKILGWEYLDARNVEINFSDSESAPLHLTLQYEDDMADLSDALLFAVLAKAFAKAGLSEVVFGVGHGSRAAH